MKQLNRITGIVVLFAAILLVSCNKETSIEKPFFDFEKHIGRYVFDLEQITFKDGSSSSEHSTAVGYVRKVSDNQIKVLFDAFTPKVDCKYDYLVKPDGSLYVLSDHPGIVEGRFMDQGIELTTQINLNTEDFIRLEILGLKKAN